LRQRQPVSGNSERDFVNDMAAQTVWREPTAKQVAQVDLLQAGRGDIDGAHRSDAALHYARRGLPVFRQSAQQGP
jgi:hypothetical protein